MTYHTHGTIAGIDIPAALAGVFAMLAFVFAYGVGLHGVTLRGIAAGHGAALAMMMWWATYAEVRE